MPGPTVLCLHGVGGRPEPTHAWRSAIQGALDYAGVRDADLSGLTRPRYSDVLRAEPDPSRVRPPSRSGLPADDAREQYEQELEALRKIRGRLPPRELDHRVIERLAGLNDAVSLVVEKRFRRVYDYLDHPAIRYAVVSLVAEAVPEHGRVIILAHSLGSVVAMDLLHWWPTAAKVDLLVTLGSPLGLRHVRSKLAGRRRRFPFGVIGGWLNVYDPSDPITGGAGLERYYTGKVVDAAVNTRQVFQGAHDLSGYVRQRIVGAALAPKIGRTATKGRPVDGVLDRQLELGLALTLRTALEVEAETEDRKRKARMFRARERIARDLSESLSRSLNAGVYVLPNFGLELEDLLPSDIDDTWRMERLVELTMRNVFEPFRLNHGSGAYARALRSVARAMGAKEQLAGLVLESRTSALATQKKSKDKATLFGAAAMGHMLAPGGVMDPDAEGNTARAPLDRGLASLGSRNGSRLAAGTWLLAGTSTGDLPAVRRAVMQMSSETFIVELVKLETVIRAQRRLLVADLGRETAEALKALRKAAAKQLRLHREIDSGGPDSAPAKEWQRKIDAIGRTESALSQAP